MLEVMAVFGTTHLGLSQILLGLPERLMQRHRIAQCRRVRITIIGDEPVPVQVDGEAWLQEPGIIKIEHKNRVQMLARERPDCDYPKAGIDLTPNEILSFAKLATVILRATERYPIGLKKQTIKLYLAKQIRTKNAKPEIGPSIM